MSPRYACQTLSAYGQQLGLAFDIAILGRSSPNVLRGDDRIGRLPTGSYFGCGPSHGVHSNLN
jgi:hypothetical protein